MSLPSHSRNGADASMSCARMVSLREYQVLSAPKMLHVPSVTMKGGSLSLVTSSPLRAPQSRPTISPAAKAMGTGMP